MFREIYIVANLLMIASCTGKSNLAEEVAAHGVIDQTSKIDESWLKSDAIEGIKVQGTKAIKIPIEENIWNQSIQRWEVVKFDIHALIQLYVMKETNGLISSSCVLNSYLSADSLTSTQLFLSGERMSGLRDLKEHTSIRYSILPSIRSTQINASDLLSSCQSQLSSSKMRELRSFYNSLLVSAWREKSLTSCLKTLDCQQWKLAFPDNWGEGDAICTKNDQNPQKYCSLTAKRGGTCPLYLTSHGLASQPREENNLLVSAPERRALTCSKPGFTCLKAGPGNDGFFHASCRPELDKFLSQSH